MSYLKCLSIKSPAERGATVTCSELKMHSTGSPEVLFSWLLCLDCLVLSSLRTSTLKRTEEKKKLLSNSYWPFRQNVGVNPLMVVGRKRICIIHAMLEPCPASEYMSSWATWSTATVSNSVFKMFLSEFNSLKPVDGHQLSAVFWLSVDEFRPRQDGPHCDLVLVVVITLFFVVVLITVVLFLPVLMMERLRVSLQLLKGPSPSLRPEESSSLIPPILMLLFQSLWLDYSHRRARHIRAVCLNAVTSSTSILSHFLN